MKDSNNGKMLEFTKAWHAARLSGEDSDSVKRRLAGEFGISLPSKRDILSACRKLDLSLDDVMQKDLRKRAVRTLSGVAPVAVLLEPRSCPGRCAYCPNLKEVPRSYLPDEPAVMRAIRCSFRAYAQVHDRLRALVASGHTPEKIELIIIGGTWGAYPEAYRLAYVADCYRAANDFSSGLRSRPLPRRRSAEFYRQALKEAQRLNEKAVYRMVGVTVETRPDHVNEYELRLMREMGVTRVELGLQIADDEVLRLNRRDSTVVDIARATALLRQAAFKITYHIMPGLPGSSVEKDVEKYGLLFSDPRFQPDQIKFYPTVVTRGSLLFRWWKSGKYQPYEDDELIELIRQCKEVTPPYVRIVRLIRDIPEKNIMAGNKVTNLRQVLQAKGFVCRCIRCREAKTRPVSRVYWREQSYEAAGGKEVFLSAESKDGSILYGFCRLRMSKAGDIIFPELEQAALIRELHVYGELAPLSEKKAVQHRGLGRELVERAENKARKSGFAKMAIIAGVGVREYYRRVGYRLSGTYMLKKLAKY